MAACGQLRRWDMMAKGILNLLLPDQGLTRLNNEDSFMVLAKHLMLFLADE